jgi:hypothetical protein
MKKQRKHYTPEEKVAILRRHLAEVVNLLLMHGCGRSVGPLCNFDCEHKNWRQPFRLGRLLRRFRWLTGNLGAPGKSFRAKRLYDVDARGACRREHRSDYRRA